MSTNERGGIISSLILIPVGAVLVAGFFFLGYYVGRYQSKTATPGDGPPPLPEIVSQNLPKPEDFTFYKTLTEKENKTVSIDLRPSAQRPEEKTDKGASESSVPLNAPPQPSRKEEKNERSGRQRSSANRVANRPQPQEKIAPAKTAASSKLHYSIQIASYPVKQQADDDVRKMKQNGYAAFVVASEVPSKGTWYRVRLGSFSNKQAADKLRRELSVKVGIASIVVIE